MNARDVQSSGQVWSEQGVADALSQIRRHEERWDEYRRAMRDHTSRFEEAAAGMGTKNYFVQKDLAARREIDTYVGRLAREQAEVLTQTVRAVAEAADPQQSRIKGGGA